MATTCWLFFDPVVDPETIADFAGHTHDSVYKGDCPEGGYLVPCEVCHVDTSKQVLTYDTAVSPPDESGVIITPIGGAPGLAPMRIVAPETKDAWEDVHSETASDGGRPEALASTLASIPPSPRSVSDGGEEGSGGSAPSGFLRWVYGKP